LTRLIRSAALATFTVLGALSPARSAAQSTPPATDSAARIRGEIRGRVINAASKTPIGIATVEVERMTVNVSDVERTLLDALDHPRLVGGMRRALDLFSTGLARADLNTLIGHAVRGSRHSTCQRVGVLLERRGARRSLLTRLERKVRERKTLLSMVPRAPRSGRISKRWNVVENDL